VKTGFSVPKDSSKVVLIAKLIEFEYTSILWKLIHAVINLTQPLASL